MVVSDKPVFPLAGKVRTGWNATRLTVAVADLLLSATLVALTITVCCVAMLTGAIYNPVLETVPVLGVTDHVTSVFGAFTTVAENCCA